MGKPSTWADLWADLGVVALGALFLALFGALHTAGAPNWIAVVVALLAVGATYQLIQHLRRRYEP